jgi:large subunit ribosomal protein L35
MCQGPSSFICRNRPGRGHARRTDWTPGAIVPKQKTHKASKKRFRVTATGMLKRMQASKKHLLSHKTSKRKRKLSRSIVDGGKLSRKYIAIMGGKA